MTRPLRGVARLNGNSNRADDAALDGPSNRPGRLCSLTTRPTDHASIRVKASAQLATHEPLTFLGPKRPVKARARRRSAPNVRRASSPPSAPIKIARISHGNVKRCGNDVTPRWPEHPPVSSVRNPTWPTRPPGPCPCQERDLSSIARDASRSNGPKVRPVCGVGMLTSAHVASSSSGRDLPPGRGTRAANAIPL